MYLYALICIYMYTYMWYIADSVTSYGLLRHPYCYFSAFCSYLPQLELHPDFSHFSLQISYALLFPLPIASHPCNAPLAFMKIIPIISLYASMSIRRHNLSHTQMLAISATKDFQIGCALSFPLSLCVCVMCAYIHVNTRTCTCVCVSIQPWGPERLMCLLRPLATLLLGAYQCARTAVK